jgi:cyclopropane fatty-acyl-phospholipid synthase-like methyltransferase
VSDEPDFVTTFPDVLAPFLPTPPDVVERMLELANTGGDDFVFDLGCGDGRVLIAAAKKYDARGFGVDIEPYRVAESEANAKLAGVSDLVNFKLQDAIRVDLTPATIITLYLVQWSTDKLQDLIRNRTKPGTRVLSHNFPIRSWNPSKVEEFFDREGSKHTLYLWVV